MYLTTDHISSSHSEPLMVYFKAPHSFAELCETFVVCYCTICSSELWLLHTSAFAICPFKGSLPVKFPP